MTSASVGKIYDRHNTKYVCPVCGYLCGAYICGGVWLLLVHYVCLYPHWLERDQRDFIVRVMGKDSEMRKVSIRTVENTIGLARSVANGTTKFPFMGYCADMMEKMLEETKELKARIAELERKHKEEFNYAEKLLKERDR